MAGVSAVVLAAALSATPPVAPACYTLIMPPNGGAYLLNACTGQVWTYGKDILPGKGLDGGPNIIDMWRPLAPAPPEMKSK